MLIGLIKTVVCCSYLFLSYFHLHFNTSFYSSVIQLVLVPICAYRSPEAPTGSSPKPLRNHVLNQQEQIKSKVKNHRGCEQRPWSQIAVKQKFNVTLDFKNRQQVMHVHKLYHLLPLFCNVQIYTLQLFFMHGACAEGFLLYKNNHWVWNLV